MKCLAGSWQAARSNPSLALGALLAGLFVLAAALSLVWSPYSPYALDIRHRLAPPSLAHWLGTDGVGRDVVSVILAGAQTSILVGVAAVCIGFAAGAALGLLAAAAQGFVEEALMRLTDFAFAFPAVLSAIMLSAAVGPGILDAIIAIGVFNVPVFARVARASAKTVWTRDFTLAARLAGKGRLTITFDHILPNILPVLIVQATIQFATAILAEAALSYLGLGAQPPQPSWGRMLNDAQTLIFQAPRLAIFPGVAIALVVMGLNLLGDGLNDALDPRLRDIR
jgi:peptide/nickel transport system permease protein